MSEFPYWKVKMAAYVGVQMDPDYIERHKAHFLDGRLDHLDPLRLVRYPTLGVTHLLTMCLADYRRPDLPWPLEAKT